MPCGGIYPSTSFLEDECFECGRKLGTEALAVEEWDTAIHARCLRSFLGSKEAEVIVDHQHPIITGVDPVSGQYVRLLCFAPELSMSDWAVCHVDEEGDEVIDESFSRVEYVS